MSINTGTDSGRAMPETKKRGDVAGIPVLAFAIVFVVAIAAAIVEIVPDNLMGGLALALILGVGLSWIGDQVPYLRDLGLGTILAVIVPATLVQVGIFPESVREFQNNFFSGYDFTSFLVPSLLVGSILAMRRSVLIQAGLRFLIPLFVSLVVTTLAIGGIGALIGYGFYEAMLFVAGPILGAGVSASAVPLSQIYAGFTGGDPGDYLTTLTSSVMIANITTIILAAVLGGLTQRYHDRPFKGFAGRGNEILRKVAGNGSDKVPANERSSAEFKELLIGLTITGGIFFAAQFGAKLIPSLHAYVWMILICLVLKVAGWVPESLADGTGVWSAFMGKVMTPAVLAAISMGVLDLGELAGLVSDPVYLILCLLTCLIVFVVAGIATYLFGFFFVEGSIMAGIGLADMGGTGDVAVLTAAKKMHLLPFLTISSRIGGAVNMVCSSRIGGAVNMVWLTFLAGLFLS